MRVVDLSGVILRKIGIAFLGFIVIALANVAKYPGNVAK